MHRERPTGVARRGRSVTPHSHRRGAVPTRTSGRVHEEAPDGPPTPSPRDVATSGDPPAASRRRPRSTSPRSTSLGSPSIRSGRPRAQSASTGPLPPETEAAAARREAVLRIATLRMPELQIAARNFHNARRSLHLSQREVADIVGTDQAAISEFENGLTDPKLSTLVLLARAVGLSLGALVAPGR